MAVSWPSYGHGDRAEKQPSPSPFGRRAHAPQAARRTRRAQRVGLSALAPSPNGGRVFAGGPSDATRCHPRPPQDREAAAQMTTAFLDRLKIRQAPMAGVAAASLAPPASTAGR